MLLRVWPVVDPPCSSGWPHTQEYICSTNWTQRVIKKRGEHEVWGRGWRYSGDMGGIKGRTNGGYDQNTLHKVLRESINIFLKRNKRIELEKLCESNKPDTERQVPHSTHGKLNSLMPYKITINTGWVDQTWKGKRRVVIHAWK